MNPHSTHLLFNPAAAGGRARKRLPKIIRLLAKAGVHPELHTSEAPGDLETLAQTLAPASRTLIVAGGDGSVHEIVNGLLRQPGSTPFAVIPVGTGNDFAKAAGIPTDWETATAQLAERIAHDATPRPVDAGRMNDRYFANGAGIGFDATVTHLARKSRLPIGDLVYLLGIFRAMAGGIATPSMTITGESRLWQAPLTLAAISNGPWVGGLFHIAPMARQDDGVLDLLIAAPVTRRRIIALLPKLMRGKHLGENEISHQRVTRLTIESSAPVASQLDGELQPLQQHFDIEVLRAALRLA